MRRPSPTLRSVPEPGERALPPREAEPLERIGPPPEHGHDRPEEDEVVEPERPRPEPEQRLELEDRQRQRRQAEERRRGEEDEAPQPGARGENRQQDERRPLHPGGDRPEQTRPSTGPVNWAPHSRSVSSRLMLPVSRFAPNGKPSSATTIAVSSGRWRYAQWIVQSRSEDRPAAPDEPGDVPRQQRPRREQRQHPRGVDVGQERPRGVVRVAAVEPDPNAGPVGPGVGAGRLAPPDDARRRGIRTSG